MKVFGVRTLDCMQKQKRQVDFFGHGKLMLPVLRHLWTSGENWWFSRCEFGTGWSHKEHRLLHFSKCGQQIKFGCPWAVVSGKTDLQLGGRRNTWSGNHVATLPRTHRERKPLWDHFNVLPVSQGCRQIGQRRSKTLTDTNTHPSTPRVDRTDGKWWVWQMSWSDPTIFGAEIINGIFNWGWTWESKVLSRFFKNRKKEPD